MGYWILRGVKLYGLLGKSKTVKASRTQREQQLFHETARNRLNINHLEAINFSRFQYGLESGSGPEGGGSNPLLPTRSRGLDCGRMTGKPEFYAYVDRSL